MDEIFEQIRGTRARDEDPPREPVATWQAEVGE